MDQKLIIAVSSQHLRHLLMDQYYKKIIDQRHLIPIGSEKSFTSEQTQLIVKYRNKHGQIRQVEECKIELIKNSYYIKLPEDSVKELHEHLIGNAYFMVTIEGSSDQAVIVITFEPKDNNVFNLLEQTSPSVRLMSFDLPPSTFTVIDTIAVKRQVYNTLALRDKELFSYRTETFIKAPHVLTYLFSHVMSLESKDNINYISVLKVVADNMRGLLSPRIRKLTKNHHNLWAQLYGEKISFLDGGMSRIVSLPGTEPTGIRVGVYTVIPGEVDLDKREEWLLKSFVIGDVLGDKSIIEEESYQTDTKRLQEAARYIIEPLVALEFIKGSKEKSKILLLHGPLQNAFQAYDELDPNYLPGLSQVFLSDFGITKEIVQHSVENIYQNTRGLHLWNSCIPIYSYVMKRLFDSDVPMIGVVERGVGQSFTKRVLKVLEEEKAILSSAQKKILYTIEKYEIGDELLFGCILDEGEYIDPIPFPKNTARRAHDRWKLVVDNFPVPMATMLKCSANSFPYRVEFNRTSQVPELEQVMNLLFHMSMLLPQYAFPVGLDIVDKYAKIPDWLSKGVSERLTANILKKVLEQGDERLLMQVRKLLSLSPRDFFFRPKA